jgi:hypothetical protein
MVEGSQQAPREGDGGAAGLAFRVLVPGQDDELVPDNRARVSPGRSTACRA